MDEDIIDYLAVRSLCDKNFEDGSPHRARTAWILAKKQYLKFEAYSIMFNMSSI